MEQLLSLNNTSTLMKTTLRQLSSNAVMNSKRDSFMIVKISKLDLLPALLKPKHTSPKPEKHSLLMSLKNVASFKEQLNSSRLLTIQAKKTNVPFSTKFMKPRKLLLPLSRMPGLNSIQSSLKLEMLLRAASTLLVLNLRPILLAREQIWTMLSTP
jgi:hypothetical protein